MKIEKFSHIELSDKVDEAIEDKYYEITAIVVNIETVKAKTGTRYVKISLGDGDEVQIASSFNNKESDFKKGDIIDATLVVKKGRYLNFERGVVNNTANRDDFVMASPITSEDLYNYIIGVAENFDDEELSALVKTVYEQNKDRILVSSAAKALHHNFTGGLLYHTYRMVQTAQQICDIYDVNKEMVIAGCMLHDIGKLFELKTDAVGNAEYTEVGNLFGHLFIGAEMVSNICKELGINAEKKKQITHIICSHHDNPEWGAIVRPATNEAFLVSQIDYIDARMYVYEKETANLEPGKMAKKRIVDGVIVYRPKDKVD